MLFRSVRSFRVLPAPGEERAGAGLPPWELVEALSRQKAAQTAPLAGPEDLIIAADTVVAADGRVLGKPRDEEEAAEMLALLSGREHHVYTGVTVRRGERILTRHEKTAVRFRPLTGAEIAAYLAAGESLDKAGAYGIQGRGCLLAEGISGDYYNVMGLPVCLLYGMLREFGVNPLTGEGI